MNHPVILSLLGAWLFASTAAPAATDRVMTVKASVDGMVCSFCAQGILAHFKKHPAISAVHVDLTRKIVLLEERKGKAITDKEINKHIKKSGFELVKVERVKENFERAKPGRHGSASFGAMPTINSVHSEGIIRPGNPAGPPWQ